MTKLLEQALAATDKLPPEMQDELARMILAIVDRESDVYELSEEESAALDEAERGGFASDEEVAALWTKAAW
jgi:predicted Zn-dependent protease with MMP-like domain